MIIRHPVSRIPHSASLHSHRLPTRHKARRRVGPVPHKAAAPQPTHAELLQDLQLAGELQQGLLLQSLPQVRGWEIAAVSLPATEIGGDLYDFLALEGGRQGVMIGDVSGHGLAAALRMAVARTLFRQYARLGAGPAATLAQLNQALLHELPTGMVTMLYVQFDPHTGELRVANAGHTFPIVLGADVTEREVAGLPLGIDGDERYAEITLTLQPGETLVLYTDGLTEANDRRGRMYGWGRFQSLLLRRHRERPRPLLGAVVQTIKQWSSNRLQDDLTAVVLRRRLPSLTAEARLVCSDVLGPLSAAALWLELAGLPPEPQVWQRELAHIGGVVQARHGRGLSRELVQQLRLLLDEYRLVMDAAAPPTNRQPLVI